MAETVSAKAKLDEYNGIMSEVSRGNSELDVLRRQEVVLLRRAYKSGEDVKSELCELGQKQFELLDVNFEKQKQALSILTELFNASVVQLQEKMKNADNLV